MSITWDRGAISLRNHAPYSIGIRIRSPDDPFVRASLIYFETKIFLSVFDSLFSQTIIFQYTYVKIWTRIYTDPYIVLELFERKQGMRGIFNPRKLSEQRFPPFWFVKIRDFLHNHLFGLVIVNVTIYSRW